MGSSTFLKGYRSLSGVENLANFPVFKRAMLKWWNTQISLQNRHIIHQSLHVCTIWRCFGSRRGNVVWAPAFHSLAINTNTLFACTIAKSSKQISAHPFLLHKIKQCTRVAWCSPSAWAGDRSRVERRTIKDALDPRESTNPRRSVLHSASSMLWLLLFFALLDFLLHSAPL